MLLKPSEVTLYREVQQGGLGFHQIERRSMANLITTFLQTAANSRFNPSLMHSHLYRFHVLKEHHLPNPGFFEIIRKLKKSTPLNPLSMSVR